MARRDPHSYADDTQPVIRHLTWTASVDFASHTLDAVATLHFVGDGAGPLDLDTRDLTIAEAADADGRAVRWELAPADPVLGARLRLHLDAPTAAVTLRYRTAPTASALQWLAPAQTAGGAHPFLFSQCQALHARSLVPLADTPGRRLTYDATLTIPAALTAVMAAAHVDRRVDGEVAVERWQMPQPIPPYLLAFAVGELRSRELGARSRIWAEPSQLDAAAWEFAEVDAMMAAAEELYGPYDWDRYDLLVMPPSFPYGGMENPRLTFLTPTTIAGDRSLVSVIAHELAHSWTGNLVTNATAEHFWLNEGFTVYAERRILEALYGAEYAHFDAALGRRQLDAALARFADRPELTHLHTHLDGIDPDDAYSEVPYEKGYFFLCAIEAVIGRASFDAWLKTYLHDFRFGAVTTDDFCAHLEAAHPGALAAADAPAWLDGPGMPASAEAPRSARLDAVAAAAAAAQVPDAAVTADWDPTAWQLFLELWPRPADPVAVRALDERYQLTAARNHDVLVTWLSLALDAGDLTVLERVEQVLGTVGRMKYLRPLYLRLVGNPDTRARAQAIFARCADGYHPIARSMAAAIVARA